MLDGIAPELLWFLLGVALIIGELVLPGFIIFFFGIGAWVTALGAGLGILKSFDSQIIVFLLSSGIALVLFRQKGKKYFMGKSSGKLESGKSLDDVKGERALVISSITPNTIGGKVEFHGTLWDASSDVGIAKGTAVEIVERKNLTLNVKPLESKG